MAPPIHHPDRRRRRLRTCLVLLLSGAGLTLTVGTAPAHGANPTNVRVVIERVEEHGCTDPFDGSDFYSRITIDGHDTDFGEVEDEDEISPNWVAEQSVDADVTTTVPIVVKIADSDGGLYFGDDECDLTAGPGNDLHLTVDLGAVAGCTVSGDVSGACDSVFTTTGGGDESVFVRFRVEVDQDAVTQPPDKALVRCLQSPLWPQPGDDVTITVEALDPALHVGDTVQDSSSSTVPPLVDRTVTADRLEIWVGDKTGADQVVTSAKTATYTIDNVGAGDLVYSCKAVVGDHESFTGWRRVRIGAPVSGSAIPVMLTGGRANRVDVVLIPDGDDYTGPGDPAFQTAVANVLKGAYFGEGFFLERQQAFNFWIADKTGDSEVPKAGGGVDCSPQGPNDWATAYSWADTGAILHANNFRDCASSGLFTSEPTSIGTVLHETGHAPFGLTDEYCCDGGYWENRPNPTMFDTQAECQADAPSLGRAASDCRSITDTRPDPDKTWWTSEPTPNDLMNSRRTPPQAGDVRHIDWYLSECLDGHC